LGGFLRGTWRQPLLRSSLIAALLPSGAAAWGGVALPWAVWLWQGAGVGWPWLRRQPEWQWGVWLGRWVWLGGLAAALGHGLWCGLVADARSGSVPVLLGCVLCEQDEPTVTISRDSTGETAGYTATLCGHFTLHVAGDDPFRLRLLVLFLRLLEVPGTRRGSRRTRDGRTPFVRQEALGAAVGVPHPDISRWEKYWHSGDWRRLLSLHSAEVLTLELQQQIIATWARLPSWGLARIHQFLVAQGVPVTASQVQQAAHESGWQIVRQELARLCGQEAEQLRLREGWLVNDLLAQLATLLGQLEAGQGLTPEARLEVAVLQAACAEAGWTAPRPLPAVPWLQRIEQVVWGPWEAVTDGSVHCIYCGSSDVARKSRQPRRKQYYDAAGNLQTVAVYRYYCRNPQCAKGSFTNLPPDLVPYSRYRTEVHLLATQMYAWGYSTYRRTAAALGVANLTVYRWVSAWGYALLPIAALFGVVKSSGVVGVDEKYVLVPKNDKPAGDRRRWMYVYFAVDVYTYDLLHIAIYPHLDQHSAQAFLLALRAKGYHPQVIVTDLRQDYAPVIAQVFPAAIHHECIFHALQDVEQTVKDVYGPGYAETHPEAATLKQTIYHIFDAQTKRTAEKRYAEVLALRESYVTATSAAATIFDFLERHWPVLVNAIESDLIPRTNNAVELVIRRFDQHYQNFCGFESIESAKCYLGVFEKLYRLTPFSQDAQPAIRGKSPLQLAGYDVSKLPITTLCAGLSVVWPVTAEVPNP
jgi:transposase-like protein